MNTRIWLTFQRLVPFVGFHHVLMMILVGASVLASILLAGCTASNGTISNIYLIAVNYNDQNASSSPSSSLFQEAASGGQVIVRAGYFGLCAQNGEQSDWICAGGASGLGLLLVDGGRNDPLNIIGYLENFKSDVIFPGLLIGAIALMAMAFIVLGTFPGWHEEEDARTGSDIDIKPFPTIVAMRLVLFLVVLAAIFLLTSALWQHVAAASASTLFESTSQGYISAHVGPAAAVLVWFAFALAVIAFMGMLIMLLSIQLLDRLTDD